VTAQAVQKSQQSENVQWRVLDSDVSRQRRCDESFQRRHGTCRDGFRRRVASTGQLRVVRSTTLRLCFLWTDRAFRLPASIGCCSEPVDVYTQLCITLLVCLPLNHNTHLTVSFPAQPDWTGTRKVEPFWIFMRQEILGWQWHQLDLHLHLTPDR